MGDYQELGLVLKRPQELLEAPYIAVIQGRVHLVQKAERAGPHAEDGKEQGQCRKGLLPRGEEGDVGEFLSRRLHLDINARLEEVLLVGQNQTGEAATEKFLEHLTETLVHGLEGPGEAALCGAVYAVDGEPQVGARFSQVLFLPLEKVVSLGELLVFPQGEKVDVTHLSHSLPKPFEPLGELGHILLLSGEGGRFFLKPHPQGGADSLLKLPDLHPELGAALGHPGELVPEGGGFSPALLAARLRLRERELRLAQGGFPLGGEPGRLRLLPAKGLALLQAPLPRLLDLLRFPVQGQAIILAAPDAFFE